MSVILEKKAMQEEAANMGKARADKDAEAQERIRNAEVGKAEAEADKIKAEAAKAQSEVKSIDNETLGKGLENQEKKLSLLDKDEKDAKDPEQGLFSKAGSAVKNLFAGKSDEEKAKEDEAAKNTIMGGDPNSLPTPTEEEQQKLQGQQNQGTGQQGAVTPASFNQDVYAQQGMGQAPAPSHTPSRAPAAYQPQEGAAPEYRKTTFDTSQREAFEKESTEAFDEIEELNKKRDKFQELHQKEWKKEKNKYLDTMNKLAKAKEESPSYRQAVRDIPAVSKVFALISATLAGAAGQKDPGAVITRLIDRSYADQKAEIESKIGSLESEQNLLGKIMQFSKDEFQTKNLFFNQVREQIVAKLSLAEKGANSESIRNNYKKLADDQHNLIEANKQADKERAHNRSRLAANDLFTRWSKKEDLAIKGKALSKTQGKMMTPAEQLDYQNKLASGTVFVGKHKIKVGDPVAARRLKKELPGKIIMVQKTNKLVDVLEGKGDVKSMTKDQREYFQTIQDMKGDPGVWRALKRWGAGAKVTAGFESKYEKTIDKIYSQLTEIAMAKRISATGGGPLNDSEKKMLYNIAGVTWKGADKFDPDLVKKGVARSIVSGSFSKVLKENSTDVTKNINQDILSNGYVLDKDGNQRGYSKDESKYLTRQFLGARF